MNRKYIILFALFCVTASAAAQEKSDLWEQAKRYLKESTAKKKSLDPAYTLQPELKWTASVGATGIRMGADLHSRRGVPSCQRHVGDGHEGKPV